MSRTSTLVLAAGLVCALRGAALTDPAPDHLPPGGGRLGAYRACDSTADCAPRSACVKSSGAGYVCRPVCAADDECRAQPGLTCAPVADSTGHPYAERVCAEARGTLATLLTLRGAIASGLAAWWEVGARVPEADVMRLRVALRVPAVRDLLRSKLVGAAQAAIAAQLGSVNLVAIRYSQFTPSIDRVGFSRAAREDQVRVVIAGTITAARERRVVSLSGLDWEADGTDDVAGYQVEAVASVAVAPAPTLADQHLTITVAPGPSSLTFHIAPLEGTVIANPFTLDAPPPTDVALGPFVDGVPERLRAATIRWLRFGAIDDKELVVEAKAE